MDMMGLLIVVVVVVNVNLMTEVEEEIVNFHYVHVQIL